jgi:hypothetical protein
MPVAIQSGRAAVFPEAAKNANKAIRKRVISIIHALAPGLGRRDAVGAACRGL